MRHMVAVRQSHSRGPYRKWLSQRRQAHAWRRKTATAAHRHGHGPMSWARPSPHPKKRKVKTSVWVT